jgi:hypothetical protein
MCSTLVDNIPQPFCSTHQPTTVIAVLDSACHFLPIVFYPLPFTPEDGTPTIDD